MHFGIITPPVPGHLHPFGALGRELMARGHRATLFHMADVEEMARREEFEFVAIGTSDHPRGSMAQFLAEVARRQGRAAIRFTVEAIARSTEMFCRDVPGALQNAGVDFLLVDQTEPIGGTIAEHAGLPFVTICNALLMNRETSIPPPFSDWRYRDDAWGRVRNRIGYAASRWMTRPIARVVRRYRERWGLPRYRTVADAFSKLAQISQQPPAFDFPRRELPAAFHYVGPLRRASSNTAPFPWEKLDGRPLVYGSLGTLQNRRQETFRCFAEACQGLDVQLVLAHGGGLSETEAAGLPGNPLVVRYAPQLEVLERASLTLTHAGLNTVLDSLSCGVPLVAVPITYEQPAIARRVEWCGAGRAIAFSKLNADGLRALLGEVMGNGRYKANAERVRESIRQAGGVKRAADLIEGFLHGPASARARRVA
jgi:zeaxanthin glucosyltransferase